jgi:Cu(I)/Ag(I) efflux system membrane fusion protein
MKNNFKDNKGRNKIDFQFPFQSDFNIKKWFLFSSLILVMAMLIVSCKNKTKTSQATDSDIYYTCSMDPQVVESKPGKCPICHMQLTAVKKSAAQKNDNELQLSPEQMQLGNIHADTIGKQFIGNQVTLTGTVTFDETKVNDVSARVGGRIEKLYFKKIGDYVSKGSTLYEIYSEELNTAKQEYLLAKQKKATLGNSFVNFNDIIDAAKNKLLLWGMCEQQIKNLNQATLANTKTTFYSTASGYIRELNVQEGDYVSEGGTVVKLVNLSDLWVQAQVYASQLSEFDNAKDLTVQIPDIPGKIIRGKISFQNPELNPGTRINLIRVNILNKDNEVKPGMSAFVTVKTGGVNGLFLPSDAVLRDGKMAMVWLETSQNKFKSVMVETGMEAGNNIEIKSGIKPNDVVVTSGAYLLQSEYVFRKGASPMEGMNMAGMKM